MAQVRSHGEIRRPLDAEAKYRLLLRLSQSISGTLDLDEILHHLLDAVREVLPYDAAGVFVLTREDPALHRGHPAQVIAGMASRGFPPRPVEQDPMFLQGKGIIGHVIASGEVVVAADVRRDARYVEGRPGTRSEIAVPITLRERTIGALNLESDRARTYAEPDVEVLQFFSNAVALSIEKAMLHRHVLERRFIQGQLQIAHDVQRRLLPRDQPGVPGYDIAGLSLPAFDIGGDYYDYIPLGDGRLGLVVADVSGKGIPAALIMSTFRALLRTCARRGASVTAAVEEVNALLSESIGLPAFVTAVYGVLDPESGSFTYANCGHNAPVIVRASGETDRLASSGPFLGVFEGARYVEQETRLGPGDVLVLYTDGVVEPERGDGEEFGLGRLVSTVTGARQRPANELIGATLAATHAFTGSENYPDDFTVVVVRRAE